jgi:uncharacterized phage-like protein YoqJ
MALLVAREGIEELWFGGARGTDTVALLAALAHRKEGRPKLVVVVPDKVSRQPYEAQAAIRRADQVIELGHPITKEDRYAAFKERNVYLVDHTSFLVAFWTGDYKTGTGHAVAYAERDGIKVYKIPVRGLPK